LVRNDVVRVHRLPGDHRLGGDRCDQFSLVPPFVKLLEDRPEKILCLRV
jgi:hypothetical protein